MDEVDAGELVVNLEDEGVGQFAEYWEAGDELELDHEKVAEARGEELEFMQGIGVWEESTREECWASTGKLPVTTKWVDVDKGRNGEVKVRSRLVARDFRVKGDDRQFEVFAAMPPIEAKRLLFRMAMMDGSVGGDKRRGAVKLMFVDIKKAHLNGKLTEDEYAYVQLPPEAGGGVGRLRRWFYGMRPAASAWEEDYSKNLESIGFKRGKSASTTFFHAETGVRLVVWGDDFTFMGRGEDIKMMRNHLDQWYETTSRRTLGPEPGDYKEVRILNRTLKWGPNGITYEGDDKHAKTVISAMGLLADSKGLDQAVIKEDTGEDESDELGPVPAKRYRSIAAVVNYTSLDRPDLQFAASLLGRSMARPTVAAEARLKKVARYLVSHPRVTYFYPAGQLEGEVEIIAWSDSDWAGCRVSRRSTSGGLLSVAGGVIKSWSNRQGSVALSSGEAEFYAAGKAAVEALGARSLFADLGWRANLQICMDAEAARAIASRQGIGKVRHLEVRYLWLQDQVRRGAIRLVKVWGKENPADVLTKPMGFGDAMRLLRLLNLAEG